MTADIGPVLEQYGVTPPARSGWAPVRCPFHDDGRASASVNTSKGAFCCHTCGVKGDTIALVMEREGLGFLDAVEWIKSLGVEVEGVRDRDEKPPRKHRPLRGQGDALSTQTTAKRRPLR